LSEEVRYWLIAWVIPVADFKLSKWYLDCVTDSGDVSIAYTGAAQWGMLHLHYSSLLESRSGSIRTKHSLREVGEPKLSGKEISWRADVLQIEGEWQADSETLRETIYSSDAGCIDWLCVMPRANARLGDRRGLGYAEKLTMTIPPWKMPIQTLRWGRFLSPSDWVVWIDWRGEFSRHVVYQNGKAVATSVLDDDSIEIENGTRLTLDRSLVIREGPLGTTALSVVPGIRKTFPARLLEVDECKWRSRARLQRVDGSTVEGWAIHEKVTWPQ
jgi:hypothetical protein